jgi:hypothetical protein
MQTNICIVRGSNQRPLEEGVVCVCTRVEGKSVVEMWNHVEKGLTTLPSQHNY